MSTVSLSYGSLISFYHKNMRVMVILRDFYEQLFLLYFNITTLKNLKFCKGFLLVVILKYTYMQKNLF